MATGDATVTMAVVPSPAAEPPIVGLVASLGPPGGAYLDPPDTFDAWNWAAFNPWAAPPARWTAEAVVAAGGRWCASEPLTAAQDRTVAAAIFAGLVDGSDDKQVAALVEAVQAYGCDAVYERIVASADAAGLGLPRYGGAPLFPGDGPARPDEPRSPLGPNRARWEDGFQYLPEQVCTTGTVQDPCSPDLTGVAAQPDVVKEQPFLVWAADRCSSFGWAAHDYRGRAIRALLAAESKQIAAEQWNGTRAQAAGWPNAYLASDVMSDTLTAPGVPAVPANALDLLEQGLAARSNGQRGAIYCTPQLGSFWSGLGQTLRTVNGVIVTYRGTVVIPDAGYDGRGPQGQPAVGGSQWAYATLLPTVRRGEVVVAPDTYAEALDRSTNTVTWRAWRLAAVTWPACAQVAAEVSMPLALLGGVS